MLWVWAQCSVSGKWARSIWLWLLGLGIFYSSLNLVGCRGDGVLGGGPAVRSLFLTATLLHHCFILQTKFKYTHETLVVSNQEIPLVENEQRLYCYGTLTMEICFYQLIEFGLGIENSFNLNWHFCEFQRNENHQLDFIRPFLIWGLLYVWLCYNFVFTCVTSWKLLWIDWLTYLLVHQLLLSMEHRKRVSINAPPHDPCFHDLWSSTVQLSHSLMTGLVYDFSSSIETQRREWACPAVLVETSEVNHFSSQ